MKKFFNKLLLVAAVAIMAVSCTGEKQAKYVFYFIGDGMGFSHISLTEGYKATEEGKIGNEPLCFSQFPVMGMATSYSANKYITCSSAAGTALATGSKTNNGMLGTAPDSSNLTAISYKIHNAGFPVGITTSVTIDHATPGSFYANSTARSDYYSIGEQLATSGFEFFGGGGFYGAKDKREAEKSLYDLAAENGYSIAYGVDEYAKAKESAKAADGSQKMILFQKMEKRNNDLPYVLEREEGDLELPQVVGKAIDFLDNSKGFFLMVEGGKIDWAAHSNDLAGTIFEMLDFDQAIAVAYEFYKKHPDETLIVVTADHETGGVTLGRTKGYAYDLSIVKNADQKAGDSDVSNYMDGISKDSLSVVAKIGWTTTSHTGGAVPVFAVGAGSQMFAGRQDNTDIPKKICKAMGVEF
ncbi:MAG: alkaline phosphatase [Bacteroidales bacterium]|nr:alkaline phosphatase [Bacteroidales bacterium]